MDTRSKKVVAVSPALEHLRATTIFPEADIRAYREQVAVAVQLECDRLLSRKRDDPAAVIKRRMAAFLLCSAGVPAREVALVMEKSAAWVSAARDYVERRMKQSSAVKADVEKKQHAVRLVYTGHS